MSDSNSTATSSSASPIWLYSYIKLRFFNRIRRFLHSKNARKPSCALPPWIPGALQVVTDKQIATPTTDAAVLRLFFHDCVLEGCDASLLIVSNSFNKAKRDRDTNVKLPGDGFDTIARIKTFDIGPCRSRTLQRGLGLLSTDQALMADERTKPLVDLYASNEKKKKSLLRILLSL
ncbi:PREDICTED: peroxidase [Prunus dulcis]|uniref:peroxidase n=1 Tax=Prunus dulcis TaxID=3755 RepID=A0A5E4FXQ0_PRUDU|nr:PREDICTED: peroxidase [Prunus dulcis]